MRGIAFAAALVVLIAGALDGGAAGATSGTRAQCRVARQADVSAVAYLREGALHVLELTSCRDLVLAHRAKPPVRFSSDGRWVAFGHAAIVPASGGRVRHPVSDAGYAQRSWAWAPMGHRLAVVTRRGGVILAEPSGRLRRVVRDGWGAQEVTYSRTGALTVTRALFSRRAQQWVHQEVWGFLGPNLTPNQFLSSSIGGRNATPKLVTWSPDGHWIFFVLDPFNSASLAADGLPLYVKGPALGAMGPRIAPAVLVYYDYLSWCGSRLVVAAGGDRYATHGKHLIVASPPGPASGQLWRTNELSRDTRLSWVSPACSGRWSLGRGRGGPQPHRAPLRPGGTLDLALGPRWLPAHEADSAAARSDGRTPTVVA